MKRIVDIAIHINCQRGRTLDGTAKEGVCRNGQTAYDFAWDDARGTFTTEEIPHGLTGRLRLELSQRTVDENNNLAMEQPVTLRLRVDKQPEKITAMYLYNDWWTRPAFIDGFGQIPPRTQVLYLKYPDRYACLVPAVGERFKTSLAPGDCLCLSMTACQGGQSGLDEPVFLLTEDQNIRGAVEKAFAYLAEEKGIRTRGERRLPEMFRYLGWCSWDAFYTDISEEKIRAKARELYDKNVPVRWMLMDDGWLSVKDERLYDFTPEREKFPDGFAGMIRDIKRAGDISWFGVWHALGGYWGGILPDSPLAEREREHLYYSTGGKLLPSPQKEKGFGFYGDWYAYLKREGIDFVKVDGQSAVKNYYENSVPLCRAARELHQALEGSASRLDGAIINCMGMAMENILARPASALSRSSDDFVPGKENGFGEHLIQNAYNALYQGQLYHCDWDMFWTSHKDAVRHGLLRAISGGPVYFSDKIGETDAGALEPLAYLDGRLLVMDRPAWPTEDCMFTDPLREGVLKLTNTAAWGGTQAVGIAAFNLTGACQKYSISPGDVPELPKAGRYLVLDYFRGETMLRDGRSAVEAELEPGGFAWYQIFPFDGDGAFLGLSEKYAGFIAVEEVYATRWGMGCVMAEQGPVRLVCPEKPVRVLCSGVEAAHLLEEEGSASALGTYVLRLKPKRGKAVLEVLW